MESAAPPHQPASLSEQLGIDRVSGERWARVAGGAAALVGVVVLCAWWLGYARVASVTWHWPPMVGNAALMSLLGGAAVVWLAPCERARWRSVVGWSSLAAMGAIAVVTLLEHGLAVESQAFDLWLVPGQDHPAHPYATGRPSPHAAASFLLLGVALVVSERPSHRLPCPADLLALAAGAVPTAALLAYLFDIEWLSGMPGFLPYTGMALPTALALLMLVSAVVLVRPEHGLSSVVLSAGPGGVASRRLLGGLALMCPVALALLLGAQLGLYPYTAAVSLTVLVGLLWIVGFILRTARRLDRSAQASARLEALVESSGDGIAAATLDGVVTHWNPAAERIYGYAASEMIGRPIFEAVPDGSVEQLRALFARVERGERVSDIDTERRRKDGSLVPVSLTLSPICAPNDTVVGISAIVRDISERKAAEAALHEAHAREQHARRQLELVLDAGEVISDAVVTDPEEGLERVLTAIALQAQAMTGAELAAVGIGHDPQQPFEHFVFAGFDDATAAAIGRLPRPVGTLGIPACTDALLRVDEVSEHPAYRGLPANHPPLHGLLGVPVLYRERNVGNIYLANKRGGGGFALEDERIVRLLSGRAGAAIEAARLHESESVQRVWLQAIFDQMPEGLVIYDERGRIAQQNQAAQALASDCDRLDAFGNRLGHDFRAPDGQPLSGEALPTHRALTQGVTVIGVEAGLCTAQGELVPVLISATPIRSLRGPAGAVAVFQDVRAMKALERLREEWASIVAHDLRQPVTLIDMTAQLLLRLPEDADGARQREGLGRIRGASQQLARMIDDLLDASRVESQRLSIARQRVDLARLVQRSVEDQRTQTPGRELHLEAPPTLAVELDRDRINQVLANLLSNAVKYGEPGTPIEVALCEREDHAEIVVRNRGVGIAPEALPTLFERFSRTSEARAGGQTGLGLGLYIARGLVEAHGGRIWAESTPGEVTAFHVVLPRCVAGNDGASVSGAAQP